MKAYKGFNKDMTCRGFQYEIGKEYETDKAKTCECGFHACEYPLDCFGYYSPAESRYCEVEQSGEISKNGGDSKVASSKIKIGAEIGIKGLIKAAFEYTKERCTNHKTGGNWSALSGGYRSALSGGYGSALIGGNRSALSGGDESALSGGDESALSGGNWSVVYGGEGARVRGGKHSVLALQYWVNGEFKCIKFKEVDGTEIKENTYYRLDSRGRFIEVKENEQNTTAKCS